MMNLGRLQEHNVREIWGHEQYDFSKWLAAPNNIKELGNLLNLSLIDIETEKFVGAYRCDILCKDEISGKTVLIENQLESTNHDHLGKIITYASGLDAAYVIWIVTSVREEHSSAIQWLNEHTTDDVSFFLLEIHAYTIGDSVPAPLFKIIEQPNDFAKRAKNMAKNPQLTIAQAKRLEFWNRFNEILEEQGKPFNKRKATTDHWYSVAIGSSLCNISIELVNKEHKIRVSVSIPDNKELFDELYLHKNEIEQQISMSLTWNRLNNKKSAFIGTDIADLNFNDTSNWDSLMLQVIQCVISMRKVFAPYIQ